MSRSAERRSASGRIFLGAYKAPPPDATEAEVDAWARAVAVAMIERHRQPERSNGDHVPVVRARTASGEVVDDPSEERLLELLLGLGSANRYLVLDRLDPPGGDCYAQVLREPDRWVVEYRDGGPERYFGALTDDIGVIHAVLAGWAFDRLGWRERLTWERLEL